MKSKNSDETDNVKETNKQEENLLLFMRVLIRKKTQETDMEKDREERREAEIETMKSRM